MRILSEIIEKLGLSEVQLINKYTLTVVAFVVWVSFFDNYSLLTQHKLSSAIEELEIQKSEYESQLQDAIVRRRNIENNREKYAREQYRMIKKGEEVIVLDKKSLKKE